MATLINLLPDLRQEKMRNKQRRRLAKLVASGVAGACMAILVVLFLITLGQNVRVSQLSSQIQVNQANLDNVKDLQKVVTVQQHLNSLETLYRQRIYLSKFYGVLSQLEPKEIGLQTLNLDQNNLLTVNGLARNYGSITKFVKALEASNISLGFGADSKNQPNFKDLQLTSVAADASNQVNFAITATMSTEVTSGNK